MTTRLDLLRDTTPRSSSMMSCAQFRQQPHCGSKPSDLYASRGQVAPFRASARTSSSRIALQTQTIMEDRLHDNENHSQELTGADQAISRPRRFLAAISAMGRPTSAMCANSWETIARVWGGKGESKRIGTTTQFITT